MTARAQTIEPVVTPTVIAVAEATDPGAALAGPCWLEYHVGGPAHWKEPGVWEILCRVQTPSRPPEYRGYRIPARKESTAVAGVVAAIASTVPTTVVIYEIRPPMTAETIGYLQTVNARLVRQRRENGAPQWPTATRCPRAEPEGNCPPGCDKCERFVRDLNTQYAIPNTQYPISRVRRVGRYG